MDGYKGAIPYDNGECTSNCSRIHEVSRSQMGCVIIDSAVNTVLYISVQGLKVVQHVQYCTMGYITDSLGTAGGKCAICILLTCSAASLSNSSFYSMPWLISLTV